MTPDDQLAQFSGGTNDLAMDGLWYSHNRVTQLVEAAKAAAVEECRDRDMTEADVRARLADAEERLAAVVAFVRDVAVTGVPCDIMPTLPSGGRDTVWWYSYLADADRNLRAHAKRVLEELGS